MPITGLAPTGNEFASTVIGNKGNDTLFGGARNDVFSFLAGFGHDILRLLRNLGIVLILRPPPH